MYSTAATKPASSSCCCVPVSKRLPSGSSSDGRTLYGRQALEELALAERQPEVRPEELVRRAEEDVDVPAGDVDRSVRRRSGRRRPRRARRRRARARRSARRPASSRRRSTRAGTRRRACAPRAAPRGRRGRAWGRRARPAKRTTTPRSCASSSHGATLASWSSRVHDDLVAALELPAERAREQEVERGHVLAEGDLVGLAAEEAAGGGAGALDQRDGAEARLERPAEVRVRLAQVARRSRRSPRPALRAARPVEEGEPRSSAEKRARTARRRAGRAQPASSPFTFQRYSGSRSARRRRSSRARPWPAARHPSPGSGSSAMSRNDDLDNGVALVLFALRHTARPSPLPGRSRPGAVGVVAEALERAAQQPASRR